MKKSVLFFISLFIYTLAFTQVAPDKYWVKFTDKDLSPYSLSNPEEFLSERAINRRTAQGIALEENDLPVNPDYVLQVMETGVTLLNTSKWFNSVTIYTTDQGALDEINGFPFVMSVDKISGNGSKTSEKPFFANESITPLVQGGIVKSSTSGNTYDYGQAYNQINMLNGIALHDMGFAGQGMVIAILDAGFTNTDQLSAFDYLWDNGRILGWKDFVNPANPDIFGSHSHGTSVLSTMGANLPGEMVGTAPEASYYLLRSEDGDSEYLIEELNWVSAAEYADSVGADVINSSLGYTEFDDPTQNHTYEDMDGNTAPITIGADIAASKGILVVNSAGNSGSSSWQYIGAPADGDSVFSIGAVNSSGNYASFSSTGPTYDGRVKPNVVAQGQGSTIISAWSGQVSSGNGTSFSSPITAGMIACLWQAHPGKRNTEIMQAVEESGTLANNPTPELGYGIPDYLLAHDMVTNSGFEYTTELSIRMFPNPFTENIYIRLNEPAKGQVELRLLDVTGKSIQERTHSGTSMEFVMHGLGDLPSGVYFLHVRDGSGKAVRKLVK